MTANEFRRMTLSLPEVVESSHMDHPDFRVGGKIFATLGYPDKKWGMVRLRPAEQRKFVEVDPEIFQPVKGAWGRGGATNVRLRTAKKKSLRKALASAWRNVAPARLAEQIEIQ